jgi:Ca2+-binding EF-hand superfamily protein
LTMHDKRQCLNSMVKYQEKSEFFKIMISMAIGLDMDQGNQEQRSKLQEYFDFIDVDPAIDSTGVDGILCNPELLQNASQALVKELTEAGEALTEDDVFRNREDWDSVFQSMDLDGDKRVDFHEFYAATADYQAVFTPENLNKLYRIFDTKGKEEISLKNFQLQLPTMLNRTGDRNLTR